MSKKNSKNQPLNVCIVNGRLVISVGIDTLKYAFEHSEYAQPYSDYHNDYIQAVKVDNPKRFAQDVMYSLLEEREDGATPIGLLLDQMCADAAENGSLALKVVEEPVDESSFVGDDYGNGL